MVFVTIRKALHLDWTALLRSEKGYILLRESEKWKNGLREWCTWQSSLGRKGRAIVILFSGGARRELQRRRLMRLIFWTPKEAWSRMVSRVMSKNFCLLTGKHQASDKTEISVVWPQARVKEGWDTMRKLSRHGPGMLFCGYWSISNRRLKTMSQTSWDSGPLPVNSEKPPVIGM